jgi:hypothetical protein
MGTNYYLTLKENPCPTCGHDTSRDLHIGKSSAGWVFLWHGYKGDDWDDSPAGRDLTTPAEWFEFLAERTGQGRAIRDEYGEEHSVQDLMSRVLAKREPRAGCSPSSRQGIPNRYPADVDVAYAEGDDVLFAEFS